VIEVAGISSERSQRERLKSRSLLVLRRLAAAKGRALGVFFFAGGMLALVVLAVPHGNKMSALPVALLGLTACLTGGALWIAGPQFSETMLHLFLAFGTAEISLAVYFSHGGGPSVAFAFFYTWVGLYASFFFSSRQARAHLLFCAIALAIVLAANSESGGAAEWVLAMGTTTIVVIVVGAIIAELFEIQASLVKKERLSALGQVATVIGHELRNPLSVAVQVLFLMRNRLGEGIDSDIEGYFARAERAMDRAVALSDDLTAYARECRPVPVELDARRILNEILESAPAPTGIEISAPEPGVRLCADPGQMTQVLVNLLNNSYQAMPGGGSIAIVASEVDGYTEIIVEDTGSGIEPTAAERLFDPFFSTRASGTGLGLAIVKRIIDAHGGTVALEKALGGGTRAILRLPYDKGGAAP
jgi:signal transduction histidine kinase